jgi:uncharacterized protein (TIGR02099 family)
MSLAEVRRRLQGSTLWIYRVLTWAVLGCGLLFAAAILALRYWILPDIGEYRERIAETVSRAAGQKISIGGISANWDGLRPQLSLSAVAVHDAEGRPALELPRIDATLSWRSALLLRVNFHALEIHRPHLLVRRDSRGRITVGGVAVEGQQQEEGGFSQWLLDQREIEIFDAALDWRDEMRAAPELHLRQVQLRLVNSGDRHRFALIAHPPAELSAPVDVRADLRGADWNSLASNMSGQLYLHVSRVDIAAWRQWIDLPVAMASGDGALRAWLTLAEGDVQALTADAELRNVRARLAPALPELDLRQMGGRLGWKRSAGGLEINARRLGFSTADGLALQPADLSLKLTGSEGAYTRGELQASALELSPLVVLADRLPLSGDIRRALEAYAPAGGIQDLAVKWEGSWPALKTYALRGRFQDLSLRRHGRFPAFSGFSGSIEGNERGGQLQVASQKALLDMPGVFREKLQFDSLTGQMGWARQAQGTELRFTNFAFSNKDLAGNLFGSYRTAVEGPGSADLTGHLTRAAAARVSAYLPLQVGPSSRAWLDRAFVDGSSTDVRFRLKGDLRQFPFSGERGGLFEVTTKIQDGALHTGEGWPRITGIDADLLFRGQRMELNARQAAIGDIRLARVRAVIPDLIHHEEILEVSGEAEGQSADFLQYIAQSPVRAMIDGFTDGMQAQGRGRLGLRLTLPLRNLKTGKVAGSYQFTNNQIVPEPGFPPLEQVNGRLEFTESTVRVPAATAQFLGGPLTVSAGSQRDAAVSIQFQGRINADAARRAGGGQWLRHMRGGTDWRGTLTMRNRRTDFVIDSSLQGLAVSLPAPFTKSAAETMPLRFERRFTGAQQERVVLAVGNVVNAVLLRRLQGGEMRIERGSLRFGEGTAAEPDRPGLLLGGSIRALDADGWIALVGREGGTAGLPVTATDLRIGELEWFDRRFGALTLTATPQPGVIQLALKGRDIEGAASWRGQGRGRLTARLRRLVLPPRDEAAPAAAQAAVAAETAAPELPALDVVVDEFQAGERALGRLELQATPQGRDWRIERLRLANADGTLNIDGVWQSWLSRPATQVNVRLDVTDVGRMLARIGYPEGVRRGTAKLEGSLTWTGSPQQIDYPSLSGNFVIDAAKGQFIKLEPGIGKLLGILSLQSLPRRISLDFRDIFSEGLAFDEIVGAVKVVKGVASTDNLRITGPAARIVMHGSVDLARETQSLRVKVSPQISDTVSVAGALIGGPVAGVAAFLAQRLLKDPLNQIAAYEYDISGSWADPQVVKVDRAAAEAATP